MRIMEKKRATVAVLMATYNGEKYLEDQLRSITNQTFEDFLLVIRDDGSSDSTVSILRKFADRDKRLIILENSDAKHGAYINFWNLLSYAKNELDADYFFLSDQDDIWKAEKIEESVKMMNLYAQTKPLVLFSDMEVIDANGKIIYPSYNKIMRIGKAIPQATFYTRDIFWGCTMAFNEKMLNIIPLAPLDDNRLGIMSHDTYLAEFASLFGTVIYLEKVTIGHRKHTGNVTGDSTLKYSNKTIVSKILGTSFSEKAKKHARTYAQSLIALNIFANNGFSTEESKKIEDSIRCGGLKGIRQLIRYKVKKANISRTILTYMIMITKSYNKHISYWMNF